jgi:hypothetical protein
MHSVIALHYGMLGYVMLLATQDFTTLLGVKVQSGRGMRAEQRTPEGPAKTAEFYKYVLTLLQK